MAALTQRPGSKEYSLSDVAVAIRYEPDADALPRIVASGRGAIAEQILQLAFETGVKVREDADLAAVLAALDVDSDIPVEALAVVAEILAHVYRANAALVDPEPKP